MYEPEIVIMQSSVRKIMHECNHAGCLAKSYTALSGLI